MAGKRAATTTALAARTAVRQRQLTAANGVPLYAVADTVAKKELAKNAIVAEGKLAKLWESAKAENSPVHKAGVDGLGALSGVVSYESINAMVRYIGDKWPKFGENSDYWQSIPHLILGIVVYWGELLSRKRQPKDGSPVFAGFGRQVVSEWAKVFMLLGASNLFRAIRVRRADAKRAAEEHTAALAELAKVKADLAKLQGS